jgi:hypothetical protein
VKKWIRYLQHSSLLIKPPSQPPLQKVHKDYAWDIIIELELDQNTEDAQDAAAINLFRDLHKDKPYATRNMARAIYGRRFGLTFSEADDIYCGLLPIPTKHGDRICILQRCAVPYVLRPIGDHYVLIGGCYIHGIMQGEVIEKGVEWKDIEIR